MAVTRTYPSNLSQAALLQEAMRPALDTIYNVLDTVTADSGWQIVPLTLGSGTVYVRMRGDEVSIEVAMETRSWPTGPHAIATIPAEYRPLPRAGIGRTVPLSMYADGGMQAAVFPTGVLYVYNWGAAVSTTVNIAGSWRR